MGALNWLRDRRKRPVECRQADATTVERSSWEADPSGLHICCKLTSISEPFNADASCELKFELSPCHGVVGGEIYLRIPADEARALYYIGDEFSIRIRLI